MPNGRNSRREKATTFLEDVKHNLLNLVHEVIELRSVVHSLLPIPPPPDEIDLDHEVVSCRGCTEAAPPMLPIAEQETFFNGVWEELPSDRSGSSSKAHIAWCPDGLVHIREHEILDQVRGFSFARESGARSLVNMADHFHDLTLAIATAVPIDDFDDFDTEASDDQAPQRGPEASSTALAINYFLVLITSLRSPSFAGDFSEHLRHVWREDEEFANYLMSPDVCAQPYDSLMNILRSIDPSHQALPQYNGMLLNRGQLREEFVAHGRRRLSSHHGHILLPKPNVLV